MRILLAPLGSEGDVNPFLWLAAGLKARGHAVTLLLSPYYGWLADARGLAWQPVGIAEDFLKFAQTPLIWHPRRGTKLVIQGTLAQTESFRAAFEKTGGDFDLLITSTLGFAISFLAEARGIPRLHVHLQPVCLRSVHDPPLFLHGMEWLKTSPLWLKRAFAGFIDWKLNRLMRRAVNEFRRGLGLRPIHQVHAEVLMAGERLAGLFPGWFAQPQPDWPGNFRQFGFPLPPVAPAPLAPELEAFLAAGPPPVLWSHGSANFHVEEFQAAALAASRELGERCLLVSLEPPAGPLPEFAFHVPHARFEHLFPRCRAVVNHGGIGTISKAMAAGCPQLAVSMAHDQPDNAARLRKLGIGAEVPRPKLTPQRAAAALRHLLHSPEVEARCAEIRDRLRRANP
ncbi:MAG TPA: glycosyltransferase, partial [Chthoniobacterales bacterium]